MGRQQLSKVELDLKPDSLLGYGTNKGQHVWYAVLCWTNQYKVLILLLYSLSTFKSEELEVDLENWIRALNHQMPIYWTSKMHWKAVASHQILSGIFRYYFRPCPTSFYLISTLP